MFGVKKREKKPACRQTTLIVDERMSTLRGFVVPEDGFLQMVRET